MFSKFIWVCTALLMLSGSLLADTTWVAAGYVWGNWTAEHSPYMIQGDITVADTSALSIGAGVRVFFQNQDSLTILGHFRAVGTAGDSVVFTSDTTGGTGWAGIVHWQALLGDTVVLSYCVIENASYFAGFRALAANSRVRLQSCAIRHCVRGSGGTGGGVAAQCDSCRVDLQDCEIAYNYGGVGGGVYFDHSSTASVKHCDFHQNSAMDGGAVRSSSSRPVTLDSCILHDNHGTIWAGAILPSGEGLTTITHCTLYQNAADEGGAIDVMGDVEINHCLIYGNQATDGGAIRIRNGNHVSLTNCTLVDNLSNGNAALYMAVGTVRNCIIAFNRGGYGVSGSSGPARYCAVFGNDSGQIHAYTSYPRLGVIDTVNANGDSCDVYANILLNPLFADTAMRDYHLTGGSPCIDAGDPSLPCDPDGTIPDMGAYHFPHSGHAPLPDTLISPPNADILYQHGTTRFRWSRTTDPDPCDSITGYVLHMASPDTAFTFPAGQLLQLDIDVESLHFPNNEYWIHWWVEAHSLLPDTSVASDTFRFWPEFPNSASDLILHPLSFSLSAAPNPFNPATWITFDLPKAGNVSMKVFDVLGREVTTMSDGRMLAGEHQILFDGTNLASGTYLIRLKASGAERTRKIMLLK